eukprot:scaffold80795_cov76-Cyclotella_meneghiniana.AAC.1
MAVEGRIGKTSEIRARKALLAHVIGEAGKVEKEDVWVDESMVKSYGNVDEFDCERRCKRNCLWTSVHNNDHCSRRQAGGRLISAWGWGPGACVCCVPTKNEK